MEYITALRHEHLLGDIDLSTASGLEIGPLFMPVVSRDQGQISYLDYLDTQGLREKYTDDPNVPTEQIVDVDYVLDGRQLAEITGRTFDYVVASHVIEHVPNLLGWLDEVEGVLAAGGKLLLVVPDRRFTFDYLRRESELGDVLTASILDSARPSPAQLIDYHLGYRVIPADQAWAGTLTPDELDPATVDRARTDARESADQGIYHDTHCWVFTSYSFARLMARCAGLGLTRFGVTHFADTPRGVFEFYVVAEPMADSAAAAESWERMADEIASTDRGLPGQVQSGDALHLRARLSTLEDELAQARAEVAQAQAETASTRQELSEAHRILGIIQTSGSYRLSRQLGRPLRVLRERRPAPTK